jgi:hypothetical protein
MLSTEMRQKRNSADVTHSTRVVFAVGCCWLLCCLRYPRTAAAAADQAGMKPAGSSGKPSYPLVSLVSDYQ